MIEKNPYNLKPIKSLESFARKQFGNHFVYYKRKGNYSYCHCSECGKRYVLRAVPTQDPFEDAAMDIEKPERDMKTICRECGTKAVYKPAGSCKPEYYYNYIVYGQKIDDETFVFRVYYSNQRTHKDCPTYYSVREEKRIILQKGKKPVRYSSYYRSDGWVKCTTGENWYYTVHPRTFANIKNTGMFKYVPVCKEIAKSFMRGCWVMDYYIAAARYPDLEMILKMGLTDYAARLVHKYPTNINPRGKTIENRLRVYKNRIPYMIREKGSVKSTHRFQTEKKYGQHWTDEEIKIFDNLNDRHFGDGWMIALKYMTLTKLKNYMTKQNIYPVDNDPWKASAEKRQIREEYYDYLQMRADQGYDMTNDIILFPKDLKRRHDEMVIEAEKAKLDKRIKEVSMRFPSIKRRYAKLSEKYSAAAGGYIIRPAKDAAEIVTEGRILHHCVGTDRYLEKHNKGASAILFLRPIKDKDNPFITVEIKDEQILQWYGAYDKKPQMKMIDAWLEKYIKELKKHEKMIKNDKKSPKTAKKSKKTKQNVSKTA